MKKICLIILLCLAVTGCVDDTDKAFNNAESIRMICSRTKWIMQTMEGLIDFEVKLKNNKVHPTMIPLFHRHQLQCIDHITDMIRHNKELYEG